MLRSPKYPQSINLHWDGWQTLTNTPSVFEREWHGSHVHAEQKLLSGRILACTLNICLSWGTFGSYLWRPNLPNFPAIEQFIFSKIFRGQKSHFLGDSGSKFSKIKGEGLFMYQVKKSNRFHSNPYPESWRKQRGLSVHIENKEGFQFTTDSSPNPSGEETRPPVLVFPNSFLARIGSLRPNWKNYEKRLGQWDVAPGGSSKISN